MLAILAPPVADQFEHLDLRPYGAAGLAGRCRRARNQYGDGGVDGEEILRVLIQDERIEAAIAEEIREPCSTEADLGDRFQVRRSVENRLRDPLREELEVLRIETGPR